MKKYYLLIIVFSFIFEMGFSQTSKVFNNFKGTLELGRKKYNQALFWPNNDLQGKLESFKSALSFFEEFIGSNPKSDSAFYYRGSIKYEIGRLIGTIANGDDYYTEMYDSFNASIVDLNSAIKINSRYYESYVLLAEVWSNLHMDMVFEVYGDLIKQFPNEADPYMRRAEFKMQHFMEDEAISDFEKAAEIAEVDAFKDGDAGDVTCAWAYYNIGMIKFKSGNIKGACESWGLANSFGSLEAAQSMKKSCK
jgi:tetratricopeptide (TPR) repeat protein